MYKYDFIDNLCIVFVLAVKLCLHRNVFCETSTDVIYKLSTNDSTIYIYIYIYIYMCVCVCVCVRVCVCVCVHIYNVFYY